ncbi:type II toxin-antitoxin system HipA family toxinoxin YjjJ [Lysobacter pythonis]|uniref:Type II toxin-antitoxin system HipA family toxinoxin YjjJ n=1 Tax=Solilutibacter pythonis TaxID=2483112 RepID=A0A3M2HTD3_9GAMM|nr:type II toxin-antitoxin system HipA family toxin YjjJ [Lysobacter pythonis]RMH90930.1 type II toxin-antitoxin system HipA family toxinoxin YjjJ [Lysobacter pythonis]
MPQPERLPLLEARLRQGGPQPASALAAALGVSQPTLSRALRPALADGRIARIGRARATRYALTRPVAALGRHWPLYRLDAQARPERLGELHALHGDAMWLAPDRPLPALMHEDARNGLYPGLPWFLDDQRPQGFLGRAFARRVAADIGAPADLTVWRPDDYLAALLRFGEDAPGDLILGDAALERALGESLSPSDALTPDERPERYPALALASLSGEEIGSSAGGEQPKFTAILREADGHRPVIVKFNEAADTPSARRWADLLRTEHLAGEILRRHGLAAARTGLFKAAGRVFLESTRFDRTPVLGRRGLVSLGALDAAFYGHGRIDWPRFAPALVEDGWLTPADGERLALYGWFGTLIGNNDMHLGNAALILADQRPLALAPCYDMLPMRFRPNPQGEVVPRDYEITPPLPTQLGAWRQAARMARDFWRAVENEAAVSDGFKPIARQALATLEAALRRFG